MLVRTLRILNKNTSSNISLLGRSSRRLIHTGGVTNQAKNSDKPTASRKKDDETKSPSTLAKKIKNLDGTAAALNRLLTTAQVKKCEFSIKSTPVAINKSSDATKPGESKPKHDFSSPEIHAEHNGYKKYINQRRYETLSKVDRDSLNKVLFTYTGYYALHKKYISVDQFLSMPIEARYHLTPIFYNAEEERWEAQRVRGMADCIFRNNHFNLDLYISLTDDKRQVLIKLLTCSRTGLTLIKEGYFSINEFLTLNGKQQKTLLSILEDYESKTAWSWMHSYYKKLCDDISEAMFMFRKTNKDAQRLNNRTTLFSKVNSELNDIELKLFNHADKIRKLCIPALTELSKPLATNAENIVTYIDWMIDHKKGISNTPDLVSIWKMIQNTINNFENNVENLPLPHQGSEIINMVRNAVEECFYKEKEMADVFSSSSYQITL